MIIHGNLSKLSMNDRRSRDRHTLISYKLLVHRIFKNVVLEVVGLVRFLVQMSQVLRQKYFINRTNRVAGDTQQHDFVGLTPKFLEQK